MKCQSAAPARAAEQAPRVSCVIPAFNESENLRVLLPSLEALLKSHSSAWEIIVVDDGSTDGTDDLMAGWVRAQGFRYLQLSRNFGKEAALTAGLTAAEGDVVICLDADLQHPPALIPQMLERWRAGADMVCAVRASRDDESRIKRAGASLLYRILGSGNGVRISPEAGDFRLIDRTVVSALIQLPERTRFMKGLYAWVGFKTESIEYTPPERLHGSSRFTFLRLVAFAMDGITAFSTLPLRSLSHFGLAVALLAFAYGIYLVIEYLFIGNAVSGWTTIVTAMLFLSGLHLLGLGVIGAYISRIFDEVKQRPLYLLRNNVGSGLDTTSRDSEQQ